MEKRKAINNGAHRIVDLGPIEVLGVNNRHAGKVNIEVPDRRTMIEEAQHTPVRNRAVVRQRLAGVEGLNQTFVVNDHGVEDRQVLDHVAGKRRDQASVDPAAQANRTEVHEAAELIHMAQKDTAQADPGNQVNDSAEEPAAAEPVLRPNDPAPGTVVAPETKDLRRTRVQTALALIRHDRDREAETSAIASATDIRLGIVLIQLCA